MIVSILSLFLIGTEIRIVRRIGCSGGRSRLGQGPCQFDSPGLVLLSQPVLLLLKL